MVNLTENRVGKRGSRKAKKLPTVLSLDEVRALMAQPNLGAPTGLRDRCLMQLMHRCGLRIAEACGLQLRDVDWATGHIRVRAETAKGSKERTAYADPQTLDLLARWRAERGRITRTRKGDAPLFVFVQKRRRGEAIETDAVYHSIRRRMEKVGIERQKAHPHTLRHTFATSMIEKGIRIEQVQKLMGHASITTTSIYLHVNDPRLAADVQAIDWD